MRGGIVALYTALAILPPPHAAAQQREGQREREPLRMGSLTFDGNEALADGTLERAIHTSGPPFTAGVPILSWFASRPAFDPDEFRRDVLRIQALYRVRGFPTASVDTVVRRHDRLVDVTFLITEGPPETIASLTFDGLDGAVARQDLLDAIPLAQGQPLDRLDLESAVAIIEGRLHDLGFPFPRVTASVREDSSRRAADVLIRVDRGPRATIDSIAVVGTDAIDRRVVLRSLTISEGDPYRGAELHASQLALYRTGLFAYAGVALQDTAPSSPDTAVTVTVRVDVFEGPLRRVRLGAGYGTMDCFRALGRLDLNNVLGGGRIAELRAEASKIGVGDPLNLEGGPPCQVFRNEDPGRLKLNYRLSASLREPLLFVRRTEGTISLFAERHTELQAYLRQSVGGQVSLTRQLSADGTPLTLTYALSRGKTVADPVTLCRYFRTCLLGDTEFFAQPRRRSVLSLSFVRDRTNALLDATTGSALTAALDHASGLIGSDSLIRFTRGVAEFAAYHRVAARTVFAWRARVGAVLSPTFGFESGEGRYTPPEDRFYLGGPNSVRGFTQNRLGPVVYVLDTVRVNAEEEPDSTIRASATGGDLVALANAELRVPLPGGNRVRAVLFADAGFVGDRIADLPDRLRVTPGAGLRVRTPVGAIRLDVAWNPHPNETGPLFRQEGNRLVQVTGAYRPDTNWLDHLRLHFSIGQAF